MKSTKQETLEEAGERLYPNRESFLYRFQNIERKAFTAGAKWQQEQMYSKEDLEVAYFEGREGLYSFNDWLQQFKNK